MSNCSIWSIDRILSGATNIGQSGPGSDGNEEALHIPQSSSVTWISLSDCFLSIRLYQLLEVWSYHSAEMQSMYSKKENKKTSLRTLLGLEKKNYLSGKTAIITMINIKFFVGFVWYINHSCLFNAKSCCFFLTYISNILFVNSFCRYVFKRSWVFLFSHYCLCSSLVNFKNGPDFSYS